MKTHPNIDDSHDVASRSFCRGSKTSDLFSRRADAHTGQQRLVEPPIFLSLNEQNTNGKRDQANHRRNKQKCNCQANNNGVTTTQFVSTTAWPAFEKNWVHSKYKVSKDNFKQIWQNIEK